MSSLIKFFQPRNYIKRLQRTKIFWNITNSSTGRNLRIHSSAAIVNSKLDDNITINKNVTVRSCKIGNECKILANSYLYKTTIGDCSYVNMNSFVLRATIGKFCSIASHVYIGPGTHPLDFVTTHPFTFLRDYGRFISTDNEEIVSQREKQSVIIGNDVWIGQGVIIMDNIRIGDGAIIGAHAVVTKNVDPYSIVVGNPAKTIKYRFSEDIINALIKIKWWEWGKQKIKDNINDFRDINLFIIKHSMKKKKTDI